MHTPRKRFGQNFLVDQNIIDNIVRAINPKEEDCLIEIGPGLGALTTPLSQSVDTLSVIEIDRDLAEKLEQGSLNNLDIFSVDALKFDFSKIPCNKKRKIVGNLPYNISTPLLFHLLQFKSGISEMYFMLQKELVDRICAPAHNKTYGRLSVVLQAQCEVTPLFDVPPAAFNPPPKVNSAVIKLTIKPHTETIDSEMLHHVVKTAFSKRRKTLRNNLKDICTQAQLEDCPLDLHLRAENIEVSDYIHLANWYREIS